MHRFGVQFMDELDRKKMCDVLMFQVGLGQLHLHGGRGVEQNHQVTGCFLSTIYLFGEEDEVSAIVKSNWSEGEI